MARHGRYGRARFDLARAVRFSGATSVAAFADQIEVGRKTAQRWMKHGLTHEAADRVAAAINEHPAVLWPDWSEGRG